MVGTSVLTQNLLDSMNIEQGREEINYLFIKVLETTTTCSRKLKGQNSSSHSRIGCHRQLYDPTKFGCRLPLSL